MGRYLLLIIASAILAMVPENARAQDAATADFGEVWAYPWQWRERPTAADYESHYPRGAFMQSIPGRVQLNCVVQENRRVDCAVASESPAGMGFGDAALELAQIYRMRHEFPSGAPTAGARVDVLMRFTVR